MPSFAEFDWKSGSQMDELYRSELFRKLVAELAKAKMYPPLRSGGGRADLPPSDIPSSYMNLYGGAGETEQETPPREPEAPRTGVTRMPSPLTPEQSRAILKPNDSTSRGGPEDMVREAIMKELRYLLAPDVSAAPLTDNSMLNSGKGNPSRPWATRPVLEGEYPDLNYETAFSNPRVLEGVAQLMDLYGGINKQQIGDEASRLGLERERANTELARAQAGFYNRGGASNKPGSAYRTAANMNKAVQFYASKLLNLEKSINNNLMVQIGGKDLPPSEAKAVLQQYRKNIMEAQDLVRQAAEASMAGDYQAERDLATQAELRLAQLEQGLGGMGGVEDTPSEPSAPLGRPGDAFLR